MLTSLIIKEIQIKTTTYHLVVGRGGVPSRAPRAGSCLTPGKELCEETRADKAKTLLEEGTRAGSSRVREPRRPALPRGSQPRVLW